MKSNKFKLEIDALEIAKTNLKLNITILDLHREIKMHRQTIGSHQREINKLEKLATKFNIACQLRKIQNHTMNNFIRKLITDGKISKAEVFGMLPKKKVAFNELMEKKGLDPKTFKKRK